MLITCSQLAPSRCLVVVSHFDSILSKFSVHLGTINGLHKGMMRLLGQCFVFQLAAQKHHKGKLTANELQRYYHHRAWHMFMEWPALISATLSAHRV